MYILPLRGELHSGTYDLNFLFKEEKTYVMDNHLAAIWCWTSHLDLSHQYNFLHIDRHYDLLNNQTDNWIAELNAKNVDLKTISIEELTTLTYHNENSPVDRDLKIFRWDNYLTIFNGLYPHLIASTIFATHKDGDTIKELEIYEHDSWTLQDNLAYWLENRNNFKWIVNLDIDYFFTDYEDNYYQLFTDEFVLKIADELLKAWKQIEVITIALSPEMCGGWENARRVARLLTERLNVTWK